MRHREVSCEVVRYRLPKLWLTGRVRIITSPFSKMRDINWRGVLEYGKRFRQFETTAWVERARSPQKYRKSGQPWTAAVIKLFTLALQALHE
jgi:hypothetical protein